MPDSNLRPDADSQKRRSTRIVQAVPLTVTGVDALGRPFQERTSTLIINCHGCRYQSKHYVLKNMWVTFEVPHNEPDHEPRSVRARVTWIQRPRTVRELFQIGVELEVSGNVWGIAFPPGDWFPFPESVSHSQIPAPSETHKPATATATVPATPEWNVALPDPKEPEPMEDNVRVIPLPAGGDPSSQFARQVARLVAEAKQQVQNTARETATRSVAAETRTLLSALHTQLKDAAEKSVEAAVTAHLERTQRESLQRMQEERDASVTAMRAEWTRELDRRIAEARQQIDSQLAEVERARRVSFEQQIEGQLLTAIEKLQSFSGSLGANASEVRTAIEHLKKSSEEAAAGEMERWQGLINQRAADAQGHLAHLEQATKRLNDQIAATTSVAEAGWRGLLEADVTAATRQWNEKIEGSLEESARRVTDRLTNNAEEAAKLVEQQLQKRIQEIGGAFSQLTSDAQSALDSVRASVAQESARGAATISELHQSIETLESRRGELSTLLESTSQQWTQRGEVLLDAQSNELNRRAESAVAGMAERLQPMLEDAGKQTIERLAGELEQRLAPQVDSASELLNKIAQERDLAQKGFAEHQNRVWQASDRTLQETVARSKELLAQVEKEFSESARANSSKWLAELETKATETTHSTFESLFKSADWYEKKVQTQMQSALEKGLEQATSILRDKAGELSGLFASELDHYSRSYVEHAQTQIHENARDTAERVTHQLTEAAHAAAAQFTDRARQLGGEQFNEFQSRANSALEQNSARLAAQSTEVRSKLESDARTFAAEYQRILAQHKDQSLAQSKQELASQIDLAKSSLHIEAQALDNQFKTSMQSLGSRAMDEHKERLENASNSWLLTTVSRLNQQSEGLIEQLASSSEKRLKDVCNDVFAEIGESLRQRLAGLSAPLTSPITPQAAVPENKHSDDLPPAK